jgi:hypothetical protein
MYFVPPATGWVIWKEGSPTKMCLHDRIVVILIRLLPELLSIELNGLFIAS